ncbi:MAG: peptide chain release factor N(5)-glutamine methyltransferase [Dehalococcoidales bacterium]|jgi:release factor glutamine methyltransferase|nr:peptide chain release factor N(5)-glutamine methyltransferase [Dehalococcoidales bacterium]
MKLRQVLAYLRKKLGENRDIDDPSLESEVLLRHVLKLNRAQFLLESDLELTETQFEELEHLLQRRLQGEPLAYLLNNREFFGLDFYVDHRVLIPRPETETLVEEALAYFDKHGVSSIADIGTGSGAIAISLAINLPRDVEIYAVDSSAEALEVASLNCQKHGVSTRIKLLQGDLVHPLPAQVDLIIANLPYVPSAEVARMPSARYEPVKALDGGENGLAEITRLAHQLKEKPQAFQCLLLEIGFGQSAGVIALFRRLFPDSKIEAIKDLSGIDRVIKLVNHL